MLIFLSTSFIVAQNQLSLSFRLMKSNPGRPFSKLSDPLAVVQYQPVPVDSPTKTPVSQTIVPKSNYLQTLSVEDSQQEKRNRILRQKSSTETSGLGSSLDYTSADELNNRSASNSRRQSSTSNAVLETKVVYSGRPSPVLLGNRKVSWRPLPSQGFAKSDNFTLDTIESSGSSHANNDFGTPQSVCDPDHCGVRYQQSSINVVDGYCQEFLPQIQETSAWILKDEKPADVYYDQDLDFGTVMAVTEFDDHLRCEGKVSIDDAKLESKRKSFQLKSNSKESENSGWSNWSREKRCESSRRMGSDLCQLLQNSSTKTINCSEFQSLIPNANYSEMDQSLNNGSSVTQTTNNNTNNNNPSTSQSSNPQSYNETLQISATYLAELSKKSSEKKRKDEENRLTHEQIHYLVEYWDHDTFVRLRTWALCFSILAVGLQIFVGISGSWSFFGDEHHPNYSGLWITCIPENHTCIPRLPFITPDTGYRDSILCLLAVSTIFSIGGSGLSFSGLCVTALARKLYYYHSAGEIFFVSGMTMAMAVSLYSITVEIHFKFYKHRYGYTFWLAWFAAFLLLLSAINLLMDELIQGSTKFRSCSCLAKCFRCFCLNRSQMSETGSQTFLQPPQQIALHRTSSRKPNPKEPITAGHDNSHSQSKLNNTTCDTTTHWRSESNDIEEDFV